MVIDSGSVVEYNTPYALLSDPNTLFYSMAKSAGIIEHEKKHNTKNT